MSKQTFVYRKPDVRKRDNEKSFNLIYFYDKFEQIMNVFVNVKVRYVF